MRYPTYRKQKHLDQSTYLHQSPAQQVLMRDRLVIDIRLG